MQALDLLLESLAAQRSALDLLTAPHRAALTEAQTILDALTKEPQAKIDALVAEIETMAAANKAAIFAKAKTYTHAQSVVKLSKGKAVVCEVDEAEVVNEFLAVAETDRDKKAEEADSLITRAIEIICEENKQTELAPLLGLLTKSREVLASKPDSRSMGSAVCVTTKHTLNKAAIKSLWSGFGDILRTYGVRVADTETVTCEPVKDAA